MANLQRQTNISILIPSLFKKKTNYESNSKQYNSQRSIFICINLIREMFPQQTFKAVLEINRVTTANYLYANFLNICLNVYFCKLM